MALVKCRECGHEVSSEAAACLNCGANPQRPSSFLKLLGISLGVLFALGVAVQIFGGESSEPAPAATPSASPPPDQAAKPKERPTNFDLPLETSAGILVCPLAAAFDRREGRGLQAAMKSRLEVFGRQEDAEKAGCEEWQEGLPIHLSDVAKEQAKGWQAKHTCGMLEFDEGLIFSCELRNSGRTVEQPMTASQEDTAVNLASRATAVASGPTAPASTAPSVPAAGAPQQQATHMAAMVAVDAGSIPFSANQGPGFDCGKARTKVEHMICDSAELSSLDRQMLAAYHNALRQASPEGADAIKQAGRQWRTGVRDACDSLDCLRAAYTSRLREISAN